MSHYRKKNPPKRRQFNEEELKHLKWLASIRLPQDIMASFFKNAKGDPMTPMAFDEVLRTQAAARHAFHEGTIRSKVDARGTLFRMAMGEPEVVAGKPTGRWIREPNWNALKFWCETQEGMKRAEKLEVTGLDKLPHVTINLPRNGREADGGGED